jgi:hypothetical protein
MLFFYSILVEVFRCVSRLEFLTIYRHDHRLQVVNLYKFTAFWLKIYIVYDIREKFVCKSGYYLFLILALTMCILLFTRTGGGIRFFLLIAVKFYPITVIVIARKKYFILDLIVAFIFSYR